MVVQVNGKLRGTIRVPADADRASIEAMVLADEAVRRFVTSTAEEDRRRAGAAGQRGLVNGDGAMEKLTARVFRIVASFATVVVTATRGRHRAPAFTEARLAKTSAAIVATSSSR